MNDTAAVLLAAGGSTRLGRAKQLASFDGTFLIRRAAASAIDAGCIPVIVVLGASVQPCIEALSGLPVEVTCNLDWSRGIGSSIRDGFAKLARHRKFDRVARAVVLLCDQPRVDESALRRLIAQAERSSAMIVASQFSDPNGFPTLGPPVCVRKEMFASVGSLSDDRGMKALWVERPQIVEAIDLEVAAFDVDTPADLKRICGEQNNE